MKTSRTLRRALALALFAPWLTAVSTARAGSDPSPGTEPAGAGSAQAVIAQLTRGMTDVKTFSEPNGLIGVVAKSVGKDGRTRPIMMHVDPKGQEVIYGLAFDLQKNTLVGADVVKASFGTGAVTPTHLPAAAAAPMKSTVSDDDVTRLARSAFIETAGVGKGGPVVYAFVEPNCGWCARAVPAMLSAQRTPGTPLANATIRWIPLAFSQEAIGEDAAALAAGGDARTRLSKLFSGGAADGSATPDMEKRVQANAELFQSLGDGGTPTFYVQRAGAAGARRVEGWAGIEAFAE